MKICFPVEADKGIDSTTAILGPSQPLSFLIQKQERLAPLIIRT